MLDLPRINSVHLNPHANTSQAPLAAGAVIHKYIFFLVLPGKHSQSPTLPTLHTAAVSQDEVWVSKTKNLIWGTTDKVQSTVRLIAYEWIFSTAMTAVMLLWSITEDCHV